MTCTSGSRRTGTPGRARRQGIGRRAVSDRTNHENRDDRRAGKRQRTSLDGDGDVNGDGGAPAPPGAYASAPSVDTRPKDAPGIAKDEGEKRRGRRMLAGLLGTLKRHRDEEKAVAAVTAQRRSVIEQAETKAREVSEKLRQESFASNALRRARDHRRTAEIDLRVAEKELEVKRATRLEKDAKTRGCAHQQGMRPSQGLLQAQGAHEGHRGRRRGHDEGGGRGV